MYDIIGDVHGHASLLRKLLLKLGYEKTNGSFSHPDRKAIFVGDFINRGPEIRKTIKIIRAMVEDGNALAVLGNHEINAIIYHMKNKDGSPLVKSPRKNFLSLFKTINEFSHCPSEWQSHLNWMRKLPVYLDLDELRIVHACWSVEAISRIAPVLKEGRLRKNAYRDLVNNPKSDVSKSIWTLTKGIDFMMPGDLKVTNNKGVIPQSFRLCWWKESLGKTFREMSFESKFDMPDYTIPKEIIPETYVYAENEPIVIFGHYCRGNGTHILNSNICCVDSCVTGTKTLTAYSWKGEKVLINKNLHHYI